MLMRLFIRFFFLVPFFLAQDASAAIENDTITDNVVALSLEKAREYALTNSYHIRQAQADLRIAEQQIRETTAAGLPQINASVGYNYFVDIPTSLIPAEFFGGEPGTFEEIQFGTQHNLTATATLDQLIFDGQYIVGLRASRIYRNLASQNLHRSHLEIQNMVTETYLLAILASRNLHIVRQNLENINLMLDETRMLLREGFTDPINVDQLQLTAANMENRISVLERQTILTENLLKFQTGIDLAQEIELTDNLEGLHAELLNNISGVPLHDLEHHIDNKIMESQELMSTMVLRREQSAWLPSLSASFVRQEMAMRNEFNFLESGQPWFPSTYFAVNLNIPIFSSGMRTSRVQQAQLELEKSRLAREETKKVLELQLEEALADMTTAREQYQNETGNLTLAKRIFDRTSIMFREGMASSLELTQANDQLLSTQSGYYNALFDLLNARNNLEKALGR